MSKVTAYQVELAQRRAMRAEFLQKANAERVKAVQCTLKGDGAGALKHKAQEKAYRFEAGKLKLRRGRSGDGRSSSGLASIGKMFGG